MQVEIKATKVFTCTNDLTMRTKQQQKLIDKRMHGQLPVIDICGHKFYIDIRMQELRYTKDFIKSLRFNSMDEDDPTGKMVFIYDTKEKQIFNMEGNIPLDVSRHFIVTIPPEINLDPIGVARYRGYDIEETLDEFPIQNNLKAAVAGLDKNSILLELDALKYEPTTAFISLDKKNDPMDKSKDLENVYKKKRGRHL